MGRLFAKPESRTPPPLAAPPTMAVKRNGNREIREGDGDVGDRNREIKEGTEELVVRTS